jgi:hypothetical protein
MKKFFHLILYFLGIISLQNCAPVSLVKPLEKKKIAASASLGGPVIKFSGLIIPIPLSSAGVSYGLSDKTTLTSNVGITSLAFGVGQLDLGFLQLILNSENNYNVGLSGFGKAHLFMDRWKGDFRLYPEFGLNVFKEFGQGKHLLYSGGSGWFETRFPEPERNAKNIWIPMIHIGYQRVKAKWNLTYELKWIAPQENNQNIVVDYIGPSKNGSLGFYFGLTRKF